MNSAQERDFDAERLLDPEEWSAFFAYARRIHEAATKHADALVPNRPSVVSFDAIVETPTSNPACVRAAPLSTGVRA